jgi:transglutaminase-like putative cysteine protease
MTTTYQVTHRTTYRYGVAISSAQLLAALQPRALPTQRVLAHQLSCVPEPDHREQFEDASGNQLTYLSLSAPHESLCLVGTSRVEVDPPVSVPELAATWEDVAAATVADRTVAGLDARELRLPSRYVPPSPALTGYAAETFAPQRDVLDALRDLSRRIHRDFVFDAEFSDVATPLVDVLDHRRGVCQDFAHLYIGCARSVGLAARYVSGYLETDPPSGSPKLQGADASHAWCAVYLPSYGWIDIDPTNDQMPPSRHITIGWGRDYGDIAPLRGVLVGPPASQQIEVAVDVVAQAGDRAPIAPAWRVGVPGS